MSSIETLSVVVRTSLDRARRLRAELGAGKDRAAEVSDRLAALGILNKSAQLELVADTIETA